MEGRQMGALGKTETTFERRVAELVDQFGKSYPTYQYAFVDFIVEHLTDLSRSFEGDFQQVMLLAILGQRRLKAQIMAGRPGRALAPTTAVSASRLADVTGIPRETVRRKLATLKDRGWIEQEPDGSWSLISDTSGEDMPARRDLAELDVRGRMRVARLVAVLELLGR
jgi:DNA-binding transcriptional ArsR family regulator